MNLALSKEELLKKLYNGKATAYDDAILCEAIQLCNSVSLPNFKQLTADMTITYAQPKSIITFTGLALGLKSNSLAKFFEGCNKCVLLCATLGHQLDVQIKKAQAYNLQLAYLLDVCGFLLVEKLCDSLTLKVSEKYHGAITKRFSLGYGDTDIKQQGEFLNALDAEKALGVRLTDGDMMLPGKTVTAMIGVKWN